MNATREFHDRLILRLGKTWKKYLQFRLKPICQRFSRSTLVFIPTGGLSHNLTLLGQVVAKSRALGFQKILVDAHPMDVRAKSSAFAGFEFCQLFSHSEFLGCACHRHLRNWRLRPRQFGVEKFRLSRGPGGHRRDYVLLSESGEVVTESSLLPRNKEPSVGLVLTTGGVPEGIDTTPQESCIRQALAMVTLHGSKQASLLEALPSWAAKPFIGVHFRNTDYAANLNRTLLETRALVTKTGINTVYWATDDAESIVEARDNLVTVDLRFSAIPALPGDKKEGGLGLHTALYGADAKRQLLQTFFDLYLLSIADHYLPSSGKTGWSVFVPILREPQVRRGFFGI